MQSINQVPVMNIKKLGPSATIISNKLNWKMYMHFCRNEIPECLAIAEKFLNDTDSNHEFANYIKGLVLRLNGDIQGSFNLLKKCHVMNESNVELLKQLARTLHLLGKHKACLDVVSEAVKFNPEDWEIHYTKGVAYLNLNDFDSAIESFKLANLNNKHESTFRQLGRVFQLKGDLKTAISILSEAIQNSLENTEILTEIGLMYLEAGESYQAFQYLGSALSIDQKNSKSMLAVASIIQDRQEYDAAMTKYRVVSQTNPNSAQLWNNIGMCFYGKQKYIAAVACLKKALYLDPFSWTICFNLGLIHYTIEQYASAFHYFNNVVNFKPNHGRSYMFLGLTLDKLEDFNNACIAFERGIEMSQDHLVPLNYAVVLARRGQTQQAQEALDRFQTIYKKMEMDPKLQDPEAAETFHRVKDFIRTKK